MLWQGSKIFVFPKNLANTHISTIQAFAPSSVPTYQRNFTTSAGSADLAGCNVHNDNQSSHDHKDHSGQNNDEDESFSSTNSPPILVIAEKGTIILPSGYFIIVIIILIIIIMNLIINITRPRLSIIYSDPGLRCSVLPSMVLGHLATVTTLRGCCTPLTPLPPPPTSSQQPSSSSPSFDTM